MGRLLLGAWVVLVVDLAYWIWQMGHVNSEAGLPRWHSVLNLLTFYGGWALFFVLITTTLVSRRRRDRR